MNRLFLRSSAAARGPRGLPAGGAVSFHPAHPACLRIEHGRVWVTLGGPYAGPPNDLGDRFLGAGDCLQVPAGARLVMESLEARASHAVRFEWSEV